MVVEADHALHGAGQQLVLGIDAGARIEQFDVEPLVLEVAELLGKLGRQIDLLFMPPTMMVILSAADAAVAPMAAMANASAAERKAHFEMIPVTKLSSTWAAPKGCAAFPPRRPPGPVMR